MASWPVQRLGSTGENVRSVQCLLNAHGLSVSVHGDFGPGTAAAVQQFQSANSLSADGSVGNQTWPVLIQVVQSGDTGPAVEAVQSQANARVHILTVDGDFGAQTTEAVKAFQAWTTDTWTFAGCQGAVRSIYCTWDKAGGEQLRLRANNNAGAPFYYVTGATF